MMKKGIAVLASVLAFAVFAGGCGSTVLDGTETAAVLDDTVNMTLGEFNLLLRYQEAQMETYYGSMFGSSNVYGQDLSGTGTVYGETAKETLLEQFEELYILEAEAPSYGVELTEEEKAAVTEAAQEFLADNTDEVKQILGVDQTSVEHLLTLFAIQSKMYDALTADVDTEVSDEEAAQKRISYVYVSTVGTEQDEDGNTIELTDEEKAEKKAVLQALLDAAAESGDLEAEAEAAQEEAGDDSEFTYGELTFGDDSSVPVDEVKEAAAKLQEGEIAPVVEIDTGYYGVQLISSFDEEATQTEKEAIIQERRDALYEEQYAALKEKHTFTAVDSALAKLTFERAYTITSTTAE